MAFGLRNVGLDQGSEWENIGLDLDGICTVAGNLVGECVSGGPIQRDGRDGIDNVFGSDLYPLVAAAVPGLEATARAAQDEGWGLPILYVRGWNGTPDDPRVDVAIFAAVFSTSVDGATPDVPPDVTIRSPTDYELASGGPVPLPVWDGNDWTWVRDDAFVADDFDRPVLRDDNAYVSGGSLVARLPSRVDIIFPTDNVGVLVRVSDATAIAVMNPDGISLDAVTVAGRWSITDLLTTAENIGICRGTGQYEILQAQLDRIGDLRSMPPMPGDEGLPCNAVSVGVTFTGTRLRVVPDGLTPGLPLVDLCALDGGVGDGGAGSDAGATDAGDVSDAGAADADDPDAGVPEDAPVPLDAAEDAPSVDAP